jgi:hypothetical protein
MAKVKFLDPSKDHFEVYSSFGRVVLSRADAQHVIRRLEKLLKEDWPVE